MRLTLRTLLAYMDDILDPADHEELSRKIEASPFATELIHRSRDAIRRLRLSAPEVLAGDSGDLHESDQATDANAAAEYLDSLLSPEEVAEFERSCLEAGPHADMLLAEAVSCHHILTLVLGEPAEVDADLRERMYALADATPPQQLRIEPAHATPAGSAGSATPPVVRRPDPDPYEAAAPDYILEAARASRRQQRLVMTAVAAAVLGGLGVWALWPQDEAALDRQIAQMGAGDAMSGDLEIGAEDDAPARAENSPSAAATNPRGEAPDASGEAPPFVAPAGPPAGAGGAVNESTEPGPPTTPATETAEVGPPPPSTLPEMIDPSQAATAGAEPAAPAAASPTPETPGGAAPPAPGSAAPDATAAGGESSTPPAPPAPTNEQMTANFPPQTPPQLPPQLPPMAGAGATPEAATPAGASVASPTPAPPAQAAGAPTTPTVTGDETESPAPAVEPAEPEPPKQIGAYLGNSDVLLRYEPASAAWIRLPPRSALAPGDRLLALPAMRTNVVLADAVAYLGGGTELGVAPPAADEPPADLNLALPYGRLIINSGLNGNRVRLSLGAVTRALALAPSSSVAIEVTRPFQPGANPERDAAPLAVSWYLTSGSATVADGLDPVEVEAPAVWTTDDGVDGAPEAIDQLPEWIDREDLTDSQRRALEPMAEALPPGAPVGLQLAELSDASSLGRRIEVRTLAAEASAYVGQFDPLVKSLGDVTQKAAWRSRIQSLREALARDGAPAAQAIREAFAAQHGQQEADDMMQMLIGFSPEQVGRTRDEVADGALVRLVNWLESDDLTHRVLALYNINELTGTSGLGGYRAEHTAEQRRREIKYYWDRLEKGELMPKE